MSSLHDELAECIISLVYVWQTIGGRYLTWIDIVLPKVTFSQPCIVWVLTANKEKTYVPK